MCEQPWHFYWLFVFKVTAGENLYPHWGLGEWVHDCLCLKESKYLCVFVCMCICVCVLYSAQQPVISVAVKVHFNWVSIIKYQPHD